MSGSEIWGCFHPNKLKSHNDNIIEKINVKSCKYILDVPRRCTNSSVMSELGRYPLYLSIILNLVKYWIRLEKSDNTFLKESCRRINMKMVVQVGLVVYTICFNF